jgi:hypothetical protein
MGLRLLSCFQIGALHSLSRTGRQARMKFGQLMSRSLSATIAGGGNISGGAFIALRPLPTQADDFACRLALNESGNKVAPCFEGCAFFIRERVPLINADDSCE